PSGSRRRHGSELMETAESRVLVYTLAKAGSMFLHELTAEISRRLSVPYYSINDPKLQPEIQRSSWKRFIEEREGPAYFGPIRVGGAEPSVPEGLQTYSVVAHVRDPRDVMTSLFFSLAYSHGRIPGQFDPTDD